MNLSKIHNKYIDRKLKASQRTQAVIGTGGGFVVPDSGLNEAAHDLLDHTGLTGVPAAFTDLSDVPAAYTGQGSKIVAVKADVSGLEFVAAPAAENGVPVGGTTNQLAAKNSNTDYDLKWMDAPAAANGLPAGGTAGQVLSKIDGTDYNAEWVNPASGERQCVLTGSVTAAGVPNYLVIPAGGGLNVDLEATIPLRLAFAWGFGTTGAIDYVGNITADVANAWSSLTASEECALYVDMDTSTGTLTYGFTLLAPVYSTSPPAAPANNQHWFDINAMKMKCYNSGTSAWVEVQRVFVGTAYTGAAATSAVKHFPIRHDFVSVCDSVDRYPTLPRLEDDEFDDASIDAKWGWLNQGAATIAEANGVQLLNCPVSAGAAVNLRCRVEAVAAGNFALIGKLILAANKVNYESSGLILYNSATGKIISFGPNSNATSPNKYINITKWTNTTTWSADSYTVPWGFLSAFLKITYDGTNITFYISPDGIVWGNSCFAETLATFLGAITHIGFMANSQNATNTSELAVYWLRVV